MESVGSHGRSCQETLSKGVIVGSTCESVDDKLPRVQLEPSSK